jgi:RHS repeat-associated protein
LIPNKQKSGTTEKSRSPAAPAIALPKGGGAIRSIGDTFAASPVTGTGSLSIPIATSPGRFSFGPELALSYDSGSGNGSFGIGWQLSLPLVTRRTDQGIPRYQDAADSDVFVLSAAEDLVPALVAVGDGWARDESERTVDGVDYEIRRYRPRVEGQFARIERWTATHSKDVHWRSITRDNITTIYGKNQDSRIADPTDPTRIFTWLICESHGDNGDSIVYQYQQDDSQGAALPDAHEANRPDAVRSTNRYVKRIKYGNRVSRLVEPDLSLADWMFEVVFDYGEHDVETPALQPVQPWLCRRDPFSSCRAGFEVRTYRLCQRVLMFHHFPDEPGVGQDCLVRATELTYANPGDELDDPRQGNLVASTLKSVTQTGYTRQANGYLKRSLPAVNFTYSTAQVTDDIRELHATDLDNLPSGIDDTYEWADLDGDGVGGILRRDAEAWFFKPNLGGGRFGPLERVATVPATATRNERAQLLDLAGDGQLDLVDFSGSTTGFYERTERGRWENFTPFTNLPAVDWGDGNVRFVDLNGDGHADVLITDLDVFTWHPSLAEAGFGPAHMVHTALDEKKGPRLVFADGTQSIYLADMNGDGLSDLVRIRNGEICYWPSHGHCQFGGCVPMDGCPRFDSDDQFDQRRIRLADIDGSGNTDIIYLARDGARLYFNQSGNRWSEPTLVRTFPLMDNVSSVMAVDLLGTGTTCLVWSSALPGNTSRPMRYLDLMGGQKPHLLVTIVNNLGAVTQVTYASSTKYFLADKEAGTPWITRLPFPVHVVERIDSYDRVSRNRFVTRYAYSHGCYDGVDREFRGFGRVEQWDTEEFGALSASGELAVSDNIDASSHVPPVLTRTWFHTGVYLGRDRVSRLFAGLFDETDAGEYYREPGLSDEQTGRRLLDDTILPPNLSLDEEREACRALKGSVLRKEVYALDGTDKAVHPYSVLEQNFALRLLQPRANNRHAVLFAHPRESIDYRYERNPSDPRVAHQLTLDVDDFGNVLKTVSVGYGRRTPDPSLAVEDRDRQAQTLITYNENRFTGAIDAPDDYRAPLLCEERTYELTGYTPDAQTGRFSLDHFTAPADASVALAFDTDIGYTDSPTSGRQRRLFKHARTLYRRNDLSGPLPLGQIESLTLPFDRYQLALTDGLVAAVYADRVNTGMLEAAGFSHQGDAHWWSSADRAFYSPDLTDTPAEELAIAREHFFTQRRFHDPFDNVTTVDYDAYDVLITKTSDAIGNVTEARNDYRVLQPAQVTDINGNRSQVACDALGMVVATAIMGKTGEMVGDSLDGVLSDLDESTVLQHIASPLADPHAVLGNATTRVIYDLFAYQRTQHDAQPQPAAVYSIARTAHVADLDPGEPADVQHSFSYSDGFGREIQRKIQAEPGVVDEGGATVGARWVGTGWTIFNNKGEPVRKYEPFFDDTHAFRFGNTVGVSPILIYDPIGRQIATLHPNHSWEKVVFDNWHQERWDANDLVLINPAADEDVGASFLRLPVDLYTPTWHAARQGGQLGPDEQIAADRAASHASTPTVVRLDAIGHAFLTSVDNGSNGKYQTRTELDIQGNTRAVIDHFGRTVARYDYDLSNSVIRSSSIDAGTRIVLVDAASKPTHAWDNSGTAMRTVYDALQRPIRLYARREGEVEILADLTVYGDAHPQSAARNLRGNIYQQYDGAGVVTNEVFDFKNNQLTSSRRLAIEYKQRVDWTVLDGLEDMQATDAAAAPLLEPETFAAGTVYDALNRPTRLTGPDGSEVLPGYNDANLLDRVAVRLPGSNAPTDFVTDITYDAKGQRTSIQYANGAHTIYTYNPLTLQLVRLNTIRPAGLTPLQDLRYSFDPVGNVVNIRDAAQPTIFFNNAVVEAHADYVYDAVYRLIEAKGREHIGQTANDLPANMPERKPHYDFNDSTRRHLPHPHDGTAMRRYTQRYEYDPVGNITALIHLADHASWTRRYAYPTDSNRLLATSMPGDPEHGPFTGAYDYDASGNVTKMPHLPVIRWDFENQMLEVERGGGKVYFTYDGNGQRVRKVHEHNGATVEERVYIGAFERYRKRAGTVLMIERDTLHVSDDTRRIALVETTTHDESTNATASPVIKYQLGNHLGSAVLELDDAGAVITYEEYHPYGTTSYSAARSVAEGSLKRHRFAGKERDEETGLIYFGARYYAPWLARWTAPDPAETAEGPNPYVYVANNPVIFTDPSGGEKQKFNDETKRRLIEHGNRAKAMQRRMKARPGKGPFTSFYVQKPKGSGTGTGGGTARSPGGTGTKPAPGAQGPPGSTGTAAEGSGSGGTATEGPSGQSEAPAGENGTGEPKESKGQDTLLDQFAAFVGLLNFEDAYSDDDENAVASGGMPGGMGPKENASVLGTLAASVLFAIGIVGMPGKSMIGRFLKKFPRLAPGARPKFLNPFKKAQLTKAKNAVMKGQKLTESQKKILREEANMIWRARYGAKTAGFHVHHHVPLEYAHLFPGADPNRLENLLPLDPTHHLTDLHGAMWDQFRNEVKSGVTKLTPENVIEQAKKVMRAIDNAKVTHIDKKFRPHIVE